MSNPFFDHPILNSPYDCPQRHWELDADGQPTQQILEPRRPADFITPAGGSPGLAFFFTTQAINSSNAILPILPNRIGISAGTRLGIRVRSSNGFNEPTLDHAPYGGGFLYVQPDKMVVKSSALDLQMQSGGSGRLNYTVTSPNSTLSPGDKGLLLLHTDNPTGNESTVVQLVN